MIKVRIGDDEMHYFLPNPDSSVEKALEIDLQEKRIQNVCDSLLGIVKDSSKETIAVSDLRSAAQNIRALMQKRGFPNPRRVLVLYGHGYSTPGGDYFYSEPMGKSTISLSIEDYLKEYEKYFNLIAISSCNTSKIKMRQRENSFLMYPKGIHRITDYWRDQHPLLGMFSKRVEIVPPRDYTPRVSNYLYHPTNYARQVFHST